MNGGGPPPATLSHRWQRISSAVVRAFHVYANWLVGISWKRFIMLSLALLIGANILQDLPPFTWRITQHTEYEPPEPAEPAEPAVRAEKPEKAEKAARTPKPHIRHHHPHHTK